MEPITALAPIAPRPPLRRVAAVAAAPAAQAAQPVQRRQVIGAVVIVAAHALLAVAMSTYPALATAHAIVTVASGVAFAAVTRHPRRISIILGYIAGAEVLWRMNNAAVFWEYGKYALIAVSVVALVRLPARGHRNRALATAYIGLLLPSIALTVLKTDFSSSRQEISFYLAGPLALALMAQLYSTFRLTPNELRATFLAVIAPVVGILALSVLSTVTRDQIVFENASNGTASGGFGPNQVSAALGLGAMLLVLLSFDRQIVWRWRLAILALAAALGTQTALTFARGGIVLAFGGIAAALFVLVARSGRGRAGVIVIALGVFAVGNYVIEPQLDTYTGGKLSARYTSTKSSGREDLIASELMMFKDNPVLGVGPGIGLRMRQELDLFEGASHTEYTRMLAEHGVFGLLSLICLIALAVRAIRSARDPSSRAIAAALVVWAALFLLINATRIVAPSFAFALAFAIPVARPPPRPGGVA